MSRFFVACTFVALLLAAACAEGAQGPGGLGSGGTGSGGDGPGRGGSGPGGSGEGGNGQGASGEGGQPTGQGGDGGAPQGSTGSGSSISTSVSSSSASSSAMSSTSTGQIEPGTVFFSEYVEGSGNNKALEIYNAGSTSVDLGNCHLDRYQNGATSSLPELFLDDVNLLSGNVFVICQSNFGEPGRCDQTSADVQHSGDDVVALICDGDTKDIFGRIGEDNTWGSGQTSSENTTLRRKCSVLEGDTNGGDAFNPGTEWDGFPEDTFSDLGQHNCP